MLVTTKFNIQRNHYLLKKLIFYIKSNYFTRIEEKLIITIIVLKIKIQLIIRNTQLMINVCKKKQTLIQVKQIGRAEAKKYFHLLLLITIII